MLKQKKQENHHLTAAPAVANSQSIGRGRISREGALEVRESRERRDKILAEIKKRPKFRIRNSSFQWGTFIFFAAENPHFFGGGGLKVGLLNCPSLYIYIMFKSCEYSLPL